jgi:hypothetical protein
MLTNDTLLSLAKTEESQYLERKAHCPKDAELRATLCAFANSTPEGQFSVLFLGVENDGKICGLTSQDLEDTQKKITKISREGCFPPIRSVPQVVEIEGKSVLAVVVEHSKDTPHFTGHSYVRIGPESKKASQDQFEELVAMRNEKARYLLREKRKGTQIRVKWALSPEQQKTPTRFHGFNNVYYRIEDCDAFVMKLFNTGSMSKFAIPLDLVTIGYSMEHSSMLLIIDSFFQVSGGG